MKLLLDSRKLILAIDEVIEFGIFEDMQKWKVGSNAYYIDNGFMLEEVLDIPIDIIPNKYYLIDGEFILNPNWINTPEEIKTINKQIDSLVLQRAESELEIDERLTTLELGLI